METPRRWRYFYFKNGGVVAQMRRIVALNGAIPTGGADAFLADFLANAGVKEAVIASVGTAGASETHGSISVRDYAKRGLSARLTNVFRVTRDIFVSKPDRILCGRLGMALLSCLIVARVRGTPIVFSSHNRIINRLGFLSRMGSAFNAWLIRRCGSAICHGPYLQKELQEVGVPIEKIHVFDSDCADLMRANPAETGLTLHDIEKKRILFLGRIVKPKGIFDLLRAFADLREQGLDATLVYAGNGPHDEALADAVKKMNLGDCVRLAGRIPYAKVGEEIRRSWVVVTPTRSEFPEGRCMAAMEALALGVPLIAPDAGPFPYLVKSGENGVLYRQDSIEELAKAIASTLTDPKLRAHLAAGAAACSENFRRADTSFAQAVLKAFAD